MEGIPHGVPSDLRAGGLTARLPCTEEGPLQKKRLKVEFAHTRSNCLDELDARPS